MKFWLSFSAAVLFSHCALCFDDDFKVPHFPNITNNPNLTPHCAQDLETWFQATQNFERGALACLLGNCTDEEKKLMKDNYFAITQRDSFARMPSGVLQFTVTTTGNYEECLASNKAYETSYCYVSGQFTKNDDCSKPALVTWKQAVCYPTSCTEADLLWISNHHHNKPRHHHNTSFTYCSALCADTPVKNNAGFYVFISIMAIIIFLAVLSTSFDYFYTNFYKIDPKKDSRLYFRLLLAFSMYTNGSVIMNVSPQREGHLKSIDCIRFLSMTWVVFGHSFSTFLLSDSLLPLRQVGHHMFDMTIVNASFAVDTFFLLSGLLVSYMFFKNWPSRRTMKNPLTWILYIVHRYLRLTPPYALFLGFYTVFLPYINGPWALTEGGTSTDVENCQKYWWTNILYINNFFISTECYPVTWYLAVDTQLYIAAPVFLIAVYISWKIGYAVLLLSALASCGAVFALTFAYDLPGSMSVPNPNMSEFNDMEYVTPWIRCTPYIVGLGVGYLLAKVQNKRIRLGKVKSVVGWLLAVAVALLCIYGPYKYIGRQTSWSKTTRSFYYAFSRIGWATAVSWVIVANHLKWGGPIAVVMGHPIWQPLGRLSYCAYIVHVFILQYFMNLSDRPLHFLGVWTLYLYYTIPITVLAYIFAFFWSCLCELPFLNLEKMLFDLILKKNKVDGVVSDKK